MYYLYYLLVVIRKQIEKIKDVYLVEAVTKNKNSETLIINKDVSFVQLETKDECLLENIVNIEVTDKFIYILDRQTFFIFSIKGEFIKKIKRGRGPGELTTAMNFSIDSERGELSIIEQGRFLRLYDLDNKYIESYQLEGSFGDAIRIDDENFLLHTVLPPKYNEDHLISVFNIKNKNITKKYIPYDNLPMRNLSILTFNNFFLHNKEIFYFAANDRTIYQYLKESMKPLYKIDFKNLDPPESYINKFEKAGAFMKQAYEDNYIGFINYCYHFNKFDLVGFKYKEDNCGVIFKSDPTKIYFSPISKLFNLPQTSSFIMPSSANANQIHFVYYNDLLFEDEANIKNTYLEIDDKKIQVQENANPIIVTIHIKD